MHAPLKSGEPSEPDHCEQETSWNEPVKAPCPVESHEYIRYHLSIYNCALTAWEERIGSSGILANIEAKDGFN
ncbi:hypothetical protein QCA50_011017 [Cerrena zonata]|uniref:Uncharacterized protein n=1 Tax=Cerrena zonata TaxID=2478898 RepID=A0AAW0FVV3_9APHY